MTRSRDSGWSHAQLGRMVARALPKPKEVGPPGPDATRWITDTVAGLGEASGSAERLVDVLQRLVSRPHAEAPVPFGHVVFETHSARAQVLEAGEELIAEGTYAQCRLRDRVVVEPGLRVDGLLVGPASALVGHQGARWEAVRDADLRGYTHAAEPALFLRLRAPRFGALEATLHLEVDAGLLRRLTGGQWGVFDPGESVWRTPVPVGSGGRSVRLTSVMPGATERTCSTVWALPAVTLSPDAPPPLDLLDLVEDEEDPSGKEGSAWIRVLLDGWTDPEPPRIDGACANTGIVEAAESHDESVVPSRDGLALRLDGLIRVETVLSIDLRGREHHFEPAPVIEPWLEVTDHGPRVARRYAVVDDVVLLRFDGLDQSAPGETVRVHYARRVPAGDDPRPSVVTGFMGGRPPDLEWSMLRPIEAESVVEPGSEDLRGPDALASVLLSGRRVETSADIRWLLRARFEDIDEVETAPFTACDERGQLAAGVRVRCTVRRHRDVAATERLRRRAEGLLRERGQAHVVYEVHLA